MIGGLDSNGSIDPGLVSAQDKPVKPQEFGYTLKAHSCDKYMNPGPKARDSQSSWMWTVQGGTTQEDPHFMYLMHNLCFGLVK